MRVNGPNADPIEQCPASGFDAIAAYGAELFNKMKAGEIGFSELEQRMLLLLAGEHYEKEREALEAIGLFVSSISRGERPTGAFLRDAMVHQPDKLVADQPSKGNTRSRTGGVEWTEDGVARAFTDRHKDSLRYDHNQATWFRWDRTHWSRDETKIAFEWARLECRTVRSKAKKGTALALSKASAASAVERFAQSDPAFAVTSAYWDRDPWLLGTPGGTVDLRTGALRSAKPGDFITKLAGCAPAKTADCPQWFHFLDETTCADASLIRFLRQWCGYCLTGDIREHALLFVFGPGGNGKGVFLNTVTEILGDYARTAPMEAFTASPTDRHATELAMLRGARLVSASETEEGRAWAEVRIKQLTGGDMIAARFMRQDFFEYRPQFKLVVIGNHKPVLRTVDEAARRRFNVVPFTNKPSVVDRELGTKLRAEWPAILRWIIDGCLDWQRNGLARPPSVIEATEQYFSAQDHFARWLDECCILDPSGTLKTKPSVLLHSFGEWCALNGEAASDNKRLRGQIERTPGLRYVTISGSQYVRGIGLKARSSKVEVEGG